jgi:BlaI family penicillinase repressor
LPLTTTYVVNSVYICSRNGLDMERIGESEQLVMEVLWAEAPLTAAEVAARVDPAREWNGSTIKTMLARLVAKGVLDHEEDGRRYLYRPRISRADYASRESGRLLARLFDGRAGALVAHLAEHQQLSDQDIEDLDALLKQLRS